MKKRFILMAAACVLALSACGGGAAETKSAESTQAGDSSAVTSDGTWSPKSTVSIIVPAWKYRSVSKSFCTICKEIIRYGFCCSEC